MSPRTGEVSVYAQIEATRGTTLGPGRAVIALPSVSYHDVVARYRLCFGDASTVVYPLTDQASRRYGSLGSIVSVTTDHVELTLEPGSASCPGAATLLRVARGTYLQKLYAAVPALRPVDTFLVTRDSNGTLQQLWESGSAVHGGHRPQDPEPGGDDEEVGDAPDAVDMNHPGVGGMGQSGAAATTNLMWTSSSHAMTNRSKR